MATLGGTRDERDRQADADLATQLQIERSLEPQLKRTFRNIGRDHQALNASTGNILDANAYNDEISGSLKQAYQRAQDKVGGRITQFIRKNPNESLAQAITLLAQFNNLSFAEQLQIIEDESRVEVRRFIETEVSNSTLKIAATTNRQLARHVTQVQEEAREDGRQPTQREIANESAANFNRAIPGRTGTIAVTEVGNAIEGIKQIEALTFVATAQTLQVTGQGSVIVVKEWITRGDERVRPSHIIADSQQRRVEEAFIVDGEALMRPLDRSLGASAENTIRCRCKSIITVDVDINQIQ